MENNSRTKRDPIAKLNDHTYKLERVLRHIAGPNSHIYIDALPDTEKIMLELMLNALLELSVAADKYTGHQEEKEFICANCKKLTINYDL